MELKEQVKLWIDFAAQLYKYEELSKEKKRAFVSTVSLEIIRCFGLRNLIPEFDLKTSSDGKMEFVTAFIMTMIEKQLRRLYFPQNNPLGLITSILY